MSAPSPGTLDRVGGVFNYLHESTASSLVRNGKVFVRRDAEGNDGPAVGVDLARHEMKVSNARLRPFSLPPTLERNGFELLDRPFKNTDVDFLDLQQIVGDYYPRCEQLVEDVVGQRAFAFDHNVRSVLGKKQETRIAGGQPVQRPLHLVHGDYTLTGAPQRLRELARPPSGNDTLRGVLSEHESLLSQEAVTRALDGGGRFAIINVWRSIAEEPVATHPLALCDGRTVEPEDLVVFEIRYPDRVGENYFAKHSGRHAWHYFPEMTNEEALLIKQWDSHGTLARSQGQRGDASDVEGPSTFSFHSAFDDPTAGPDAPDRVSIEVRCVVLYD